MRNILPLPPKMTLQFAELAKRGEADNHVGCDIYEFFQGNQVVCVIGLTNPVGHIQKISTEEMKVRRAQSSKVRGVVA